jgi:hypothetical protein
MAAPSVFVQEAHTQVHARLKASIAGHGGTYVEMHKLDDKMAKKLPKDLVGRVIKQREAMKLLKRSG